MANTATKAKPTEEIKKEVKKMEDSIAKVDAVLNKEENTDLKAQLAEMQKKMDSMASVFNAFTNMTNQQTQNTKEKEVIFISLFYGVLNLWTESGNRGAHYRFQEYGDEKKIPWNQAKQIVAIQEDFAKQGLFYIKDASFVSEFPVLRESYEKMADKETLESLFDLKKASFKASFEALPQAQRELFADLAIKKSQSGEEIDFNIIKLAGDILERNLLQEISFSESAFANKE